MEQLTITNSRIRIDLSALNAQRKRYNFIESSKCNYCNHRCENPKHFFLYCPAFAAQRQVMLDDMDRQVPQVAQPYTNFFPLNNTKQATVFYKVLLFGTGEKVNDNRIFKIVQNFICEKNDFSEEPILGNFRINLVSNL